MSKQIKRTVIAEDIRKRRKALNMTQAEMAEKLGINRNRYARYETDTEPPITLLSKIAGIFNITTDELLQGCSGYANDIRNASTIKPKISTYLAYNATDPDRDDNQLTDEEKEMLSRFRLMTDEQKDALMELLKHMT